MHETKRRRAEPTGDDALADHWVLRLDVVMSWSIVPTCHRRAGAAVMLRSCVAPANPSTPPLAPRCWSSAQKPGIVAYWPFW